MSRRASVGLERSDCDAVYSDTVLYLLAAAEGKPKAPPLLSDEVAGQRGRAVVTEISFLPLLEKLWATR